VVAVADDESERRAERPAMTEPGQNLDPVLLDLLPRASSIPLLAPREIAVDQAPIEDEPRRQPG
jgi:hypothetical protein